MYNRRVKFGLIIPNRLVKNVRKTQGGGLTHTVCVSFWPSVTQQTDLLVTVCRPITLGAAAEFLVRRWCVVTVRAFRWNSHRQHGTLLDHDFLDWFTDLRRRQNLTPKCNHLHFSASVYIAYFQWSSLKPNTHRRRRRDETVTSRRVGGVYMNSRRLPTDSAMRTHNAAVGRDPVHDCRRVCSHRPDATRLDSFVSSAVCIGHNYLDRDHKTNTLELP